jgi:putative peptide zinc metalloprotease protein
MIRRLLVTVTATLAFVLPLATTASPAAAQDSGSSGGDNTAIAVNTKDGSSLFRFAFRITMANGQVTDAGNAAVAYASCTDCQTVAIAIEFVIVEGSPDTFTPTNLAIAENVSCTLCETMASAYQYVIQTSGPVRLTDEGRRQLQQLELELRRLDVTGLTVQQIQAIVDDVTKQMTQIMTTQLVPVGPDPTAAAATEGTTSTSAPAAAVTTTTTVRDTASTTSTTAVRTSSTTTSTTVVSGGSTTTTSAPASTTTSTTAATTTTAP